VRVIDRKNIVTYAPFGSKLESSPEITEAMLRVYHGNLANPVTIRLPERCGHVLMS
jgi:hypothetical protein